MTSQVPSNPNYSMISCASCPDPDRGRSQHPQGQGMTGTAHFCYWSVFTCQTWWVFPADHKTLCLAAAQRGHLQGLPGPGRTSHPFFVPRLAVTSGAPGGIRTLLTPDGQEVSVLCLSQWPRQHFPVQLSPSLISACPLCSADQVL